MPPQIPLIFSFLFHVDNDLPLLSYWIWCKLETIMHFVQTLPNLLQSWNVGLLGFFVFKLRTPVGHSCYLRHHSLFQLRILSPVMFEFHCHSKFLHAFLPHSPRFTAAHLGTPWCSRSVLATPFVPRTAKSFSFLPLARWGQANFFWLSSLWLVCYCWKEPSSNFSILFLVFLY